MNVAGSSRDVSRWMHPSGEWIVRGVEHGAAGTFVKRHEPWRMELKFVSRPESSEGMALEPFNSVPSNKLLIVMEHIPNEIFGGARMPDRGFNAGYNSLYLAQNFNAVAGSSSHRASKGIPRRSPDYATRLQVSPITPSARMAELVGENVLDFIRHLSGSADRSFQFSTTSITADISKHRREPSDFVIRKGHDNRRILGLNGVLHSAIQSCIWARQWCSLLGSIAIFVSRRARADGYNVRAGHPTGFFNLAVSPGTGHRPMVLSAVTGGWPRPGTAPCPMAALSRGAEISTWTAVADLIGF